MLIFLCALFSSHYKTVLPPYYLWLCLTHNYDVLVTFFAKLCSYGNSLFREDNDLYALASVF